MIKIERCAVMNMEGAIRGARNPLNSWAKSDSYTMEDGTFVVGDADRDLRPQKIPPSGHRLRGYHGAPLLVERVRYL